MTVHYSERAVTKIVAAAVAAVPGTTGFSTGMGRLTGRAYPRYDVQLDEDADTATIEVFIAVTWPSPILDVAEKVRDTVIEHVRELTGIEVLACNVVIGPVLSGPRVQQSDLNFEPLVASHPQTPEPVQLTPIKVRGVK